MRVSCTLSCNNPQWMLPAFHRARSEGAVRLLRSCERGVLSRVVGPQLNWLQYMRVCVFTSRGTQTASLPPLLAALDGRTGVSIGRPAVARPAAVQTQVMSCLYDVAGALTLAEGQHPVHRGCHPRPVPVTTNDTRARQPSDWPKIRALVQLVIGSTHGTSSSAVMASCFASLCHCVGKVKARVDHGSPEAGVNHEQCVFGVLTGP